MSFEKFKELQNIKENSKLKLKKIEQIIECVDSDINKYKIRVYNENITSKNSSHLVVKSYSNYEEYFKYINTKDKSIYRHKEILEQLYDKLEDTKIEYNKQLFNYLNDKTKYNEYKKLYNKSL